MPKNTAQTIAVAVVVIVAVVGGALFYQRQHARPPAHEHAAKLSDEKLARVLAGVESQQKIGGAFLLQNGDGETVTDSYFAGQPYAIMFGFTHCPDVCPTTLLQMRGWMEKLGRRARQMRFAFATVDPARDTAAVLKTYVAAFSPDIVALTGDEKQIKQLLKNYAVVARKIPTTNGDYTMEHFTAVFLFNANGDFAEFIHADEKQTAAVNKLNRLLDGE